MIHALVVWVSTHRWASFALACGSALVSLLVTGMAALRVPVDHFTRRDDAAPVSPRPWCLRVALSVARNGLGAAIVAFGLVLSIPGVPGQGLVTVLLGLMLMDVPGKRRIELALMQRPLVARGLNGLRARFGRPPIELP